MRFVLSLAALVIGLYQLTKIAILEWVMNPPRIIEVLPVFNVVLAFNRGVSFSMLTSDAAYSQHLLSGLAIIVCVGLLIWVRKHPAKYTNIAVALIVGGAIGNVIDRLRIGAVIDFLDVHWGHWHWPAFNVADTAISIGAIIMVLDAVFTKQDTK